MSEYKRLKCPKCGNDNPRMIHDEADKSEVLYYSMSGTPVHKRHFKCGECGHFWKKEEE